MLILFLPLYLKCWHSFLKDKTYSASSTQSTSPKKSSILQRKGSQDLPASEYYAIYQQSKKLSRSSSFNSDEAKDKVTEEHLELAQDTFETDFAMEKLPTAEVKVGHGGGIAER